VAGENVTFVFVYCGHRPICLEHFTEADYRFRQRVKHLLSQNLDISVDIMKRNHLKMEVQPTRDALCIVT
jgi:hypothetical protein